MYSIILSAYRFLLLPHPYLANIPRFSRSFYRYIQITDIGYLYSLTVYEWTQIFIIVTMNTPTVDWTTLNTAKTFKHFKQWMKLFFIVNKIKACREEKNFVFWFGAQFNSTLNFTQSGWLILFIPDLHFRLTNRVSCQNLSFWLENTDQCIRPIGRSSIAMLFSWSTPPSADISLWL